MSYFAITSNQARHIQFLNTLRMHLPIDQIIVVPKENRDKNFTKQERRFWPRASGIGSMYLMCNKSHLKDDLVLTSLRRKKPKVGFIFGAPLLPKEIYSIPEYGCVNIHTGLVQHYRGVDSSYWAIYEENFDKIGTTLHYIDSSIDGGDIIDQDTVKVVETDTPDKLFFKTCQLGFVMLIDNLQSIINNDVDRKRLNHRGKLFQTKDMNSDIMKEINLTCKDKIKRFLNENNS